MKLLSCFRFSAASNLNYLFSFIYISYVVPSTQHSIAIDIVDCLSTTTTIKVIKSGSIC